MFRKKKRDDHAEETDEESEELTIDFAWVAFVGLQIGYHEKEIARMRYGKWSDMCEQWKKYHNIKIRQEIFKERPKWTSLEDI